MPTPLIIGETRVAGREIAVLGHQQPLCPKLIEKINHGASIRNGVRGTQSDFFLLK